MSIKTLVESLPPELGLVLVDVGSAGGIHSRWEPFGRRISSLLFDPLDESGSREGDRYFPFALGSGAGNGVLFETKRASMTSTLAPNEELLKRFWDKPAHTVIKDCHSISFQALDQLVTDNGITPDIMKIDVQGGEWSVLQGAERTLSMHIFMVEIEVSFIERYSGLRTFSQVLPAMESRGFDLIDVSRIKRYRYKNRFGIAPLPKGPPKRAGRIAFCDALFLLEEKKLMERILSQSAEMGSVLALKVILSLLAYEKPDIAAWVFEQTEKLYSPSIHKALVAYFAQWTPPIVSKGGAVNLWKKLTSMV